MSFKKPIIPITNLETFKVRISQIPPFDVAFKEMALTDYENLVAVIYRLNELIEINQKYIDLTEDTLNWLIEDGLTQEVTNKLIEWLNDGTLENLINETLFKSKLDKTEFESFKVQLNQYLEDEISNFKTDVSQDIKNFKLEVSDNFNDFKDDIQLNILYLHDFGYEKGHEDITDSLTQAFEYMNENNYCLLELPSGEFSFNQTMRIEYTGNNIIGKIKGQGKRSTILTYKGNGNAIEIGKLDDLIPKWDHGLKVAFDLSDFSLMGEIGNTHHRNGIVIHSIMNVIENIKVGYFKNGIGFVTPGTSYSQVVNCEFTHNKYGVYSQWATFYSNCVINFNGEVGIFLGGGCQISNSLVEWQIGEVNDPSNRQINIIIFGSQYSHNTLTNMYIENDHVHFGYPQTFNYKTLSWNETPWYCDTVFLNNVKFSNQMQMYSHFGKLTFSDCKFVGGVFGVQSMNNYTQYKLIPNWAKPKTVLNNVIDLNINMNKRNTFMPIDSTLNNYQKNRGFIIGTTHTGTDSKLEVPENWSIKNHLWADSNFNIDMRVTSDKPSWQTDIDSLQFKNFKTIVGNKYPSLEYEFYGQAGTTYNLSFNVKTLGVYGMLYHVVGESGRVYMQHGYKVSNDEINYAYVLNNIWGNKMGSFTCVESEKLTLRFINESKSVNESFILNNVAITTESKIGG